MWALGRRWRPRGPLSKQQQDQSEFTFPSATDMRTIKSTLVVLLITLVLILISAEIFLRYSPPLARPPFSENRIPAAICRPDPRLGWVNQPGRYTAPGASRKDRPVTITIRHDGRRAVTAQNLDTGNDLRGKIILVGGSFMFGEGLSDEQTLAWKLQHTLPETDVLNYGVKAYGTYQSLLMLEKVLPGQRRTDAVVYGFMVHHIDRNMAPAYWRAMLNLRSNQMVQMPYVTLGPENQLLRHPTEPFTPWLAGRYLASFRVLEAWLKAKLFLAGNNTEKHTLMQLLLLEMRNLCKAHGYPLVVAMLNAPHNVEDLYTEFCRTNHIPVINFDLDGIKDRPLQIPQDGHPNETVNTLWADQTAAFLAELMGSQGNDTNDTGVP